MSIPPGHVGPVVLGTGRLVWWTGRVAIGLRLLLYRTRLGVAMRAQVDDHNIYRWAGMLLSALGNLPPAWFAEHRRETINAPV